MNKCRKKANAVLKKLSCEIQDLMRDAYFTQQLYNDLAGLKSRPFSSGTKSGAVSDPTLCAVISADSMRNKINAIYEKIQHKKELFNRMTADCSLEQKIILEDYYLKRLPIKAIVDKHSLSEITVKKRLSAGRDAAYRGYLKLKREDGTDE